MFSAPGRTLFISNRRTPRELGSRWAGKVRGEIHRELHSRKDASWREHRIKNEWLLPWLCWIAHQRRRDWARFDGSWDRASLTFEERLGLLVDREAVERESKRLVTRLKFANLRQNATVEDLNTKAARGLDKALFAKLATGDWIGRRQDLLITGGEGNQFFVKTPDLLIWEICQRRCRPIRIEARIAWTVI
jgi:hypothetical protein